MGVPSVLGYTEGEDGRMENESCFEGTRNHAPVCSVFFLSMIEMGLLRGREEVLLCADSSKGPTASSGWRVLRGGVFCGVVVDLAG